jgi:membrane protease YdiL (CAAX protease family)
MGTAHKGRVAISLAVLFVLYQSAQGIGEMWLHSFAVQAFLMSACVLVAWPLSRWLGYRGYGAYALGGGAGLRWWLPGGLLLAVLAKFATVWAGLHLGIYTAHAPGAAMRGIALLAALPMLLVSTFVPSLAEDMLTRGYWYRAIGMQWRRGVLFVLASSAIYVLNHIYRLANGPLEWLTLFCFGLACTTALWRSGSLWAAVGLHWGWNLGNHLVDAAMPTAVVDASAVPVLSIVAHLLMLLLVLALPMARVSPAGVAALQ